MFQKLQKMGYYILKRVLHITQAHKSGKTNHMTPNLTFGHLDALFMR